MKKILIALIMLVSLAATAQQKFEEQRNVNQTFIGVKVSDGIELILTQDDKASINVSASAQKYVDDLKTEVVNGILVISVIQKKWSNMDYKNRWVKVNVSVTTLSSLQINDGCTVKNTNKFSVDNIDISCNDGSSVKLEDFNATTLNVTVKDGSSMVLTGKSTTLNVEVNDGSSFNADEFATDVCSATANDGSSVKINVLKELTAFANDGSSIRYDGSTTIKKSKAKDGSSIKKS